MLIPSIHSMRTIETKAIYPCRTRGVIHPSRVFLTDLIYDPLQKTLELEWIFIIMILGINHRRLSKT